MTAAPGRRPRKMLTAEQKYDLWVRMLTGQITQAEAAAEAGVDRSVVSRLRAVARDGAIATLGWVHWWNTHRVHSYLGDLSPDQFEAAYAARHTDQENLNTQPAQNSEAASHLAMALVVIAA